MEFKSRRLSNGLTIIGEVNPEAQSAAVGYFVRTGSRDETASISGVSHFLEHMLFKGTENLNALEVNQAFDGLGAKFNAFTSEENTVYYASVLPEYLLEVADLWSQLMRPTLRDEDFDIEKNVILEEIAMYKDMPQFDVVDQCRSLHFGQHPCANSVLGSNESIADLSAEQMRTYFNQRYAPNNIVLACCGQFDFDALCQLVDKKCSHWTPFDVHRELSFFEGTHETKSVTKSDLQRCHTCTFSPAVSMQDPQRYANSLLSMIIGDYTGSRYFWALVDKAIAETAVMQCDTMDGVGVLYSYFSCAPEDKEQMIDILDNLFSELTQNGITEQEVTAARNKVLSAMTLRSEQPMGRLVNLGFNWTYLNQYRSLADDVADVKKVTVEDVNNLIKRYNPGDYTMLSICP